MKKTLFIFCIISSLLSCRKQGADCFTSTGKEVRESRVLTPFKDLNLYDGIDLKLKKGNEFKAEVSGGENLLPGIETIVEDSVLSIRNINSCNIVRSYKRKVTVTLTLPTIRTFTYYGWGDVQFKDTLASEKFSCESRGGSGSISFLVNADSSLVAIHAGNADITGGGSCRVNRVYSIDLGFIDLKNYRSSQGFVTNNSTADIYVNVSDFLETEQNSVGNIFYSNSPQIKSRISGSGTLIHY